MLRGSPTHARSIAAALALFLSGAAIAAPGQGSVRIEYIAHASFVIESPGGTRIVIDPFNGNIWLGYSFPPGIETDAVLVSHPHYDHDATYYFPHDTTVLRRPGEYRIGDVTVRGIATEHVGERRFRERGETPHNTIWVLETGGLRLAHTGDSRPLNELDLEAIGPADVVFLHASSFGAGGAGALALLREQLAPKVLIPMHYRHADISELPEGMRPVEDYMEDHEARFADGNAIELDAAALAGASKREAGAVTPGRGAVIGPDSAGPAEGPQILVLRHSPGLEPWLDWLHEAWIEAAEGAGMLADAETLADEAQAEESLWEGLFHYETAMDLAPGVLKFGYGAGRALAMLGQTADAIETLDHALARAPRADWTDRARVHMLLGELYETTDHPDIAIEHYEYVVSQEHTHETTMRERAIARLRELRPITRSPRPVSRIGSLTTAATVFIFSGARRGAARTAR
jgi:L-ascorbate metabolism protein UlaG (beta-lactamase superfamily)